MVFDLERGLMIEVAGLTKIYGSRAAVGGIDFSVSKGEILGFLGPNGAGKTTTMRILTGYVPPTSGTARVGGFDVQESPIEIKKRIGYLPEHPPLYTEMLVRPFLRFVARLRGVPRKEQNGRVDRAIDRCGLQPVAGRLIGNLSKGYQQRAGLAQAILHDPDVLILDEPTVGLDPSQIREIRQLIKSFAGEHTVILSTHILAEVTMTCNRVLIINEGKIAADETMERLKARGERTQRIALRLARPPADAEAALRALSGILTVTREAAPDGSFVVETDAAHDVREEIARTAVTQGWGLLEMRAVTLSLEDIFIRIIRGEEAA
jgi:ABC-2 type transport system ATP-binding protein